MTDPDAHSHFEPRPEFGGLTACVPFTGRLFVACYPEHYPREIRYTPPRHPNMFPGTLKQHPAVPFVVRLLTPEWI